MAGWFFKSRATRLILFVIMFLLPTGTIGYMLVEGWGFWDSLYMTIISVTTTGYAEVHPLTHNGRMFTSFLLLIGMAAVAVSLSMIMHDILAIDFEKRRATKMIEKIAKLKKHTVVCGFGRVGKVVCEELTRNGKPFVVVEHNPLHLKQAKEFGYNYIEGDATSDRILEMAGIQKAKVLAAVTDHVSDNLYICLTGKTSNEGLFIVARGNLEESVGKLKKAGAHRVILPYHDSGVQAAHVIMHPQFHDFLPIRDLELTSEKSIQMTEVDLSQMPGFIGKTISECQDQLNNILIVGVKSEDGNFQFSPTGKYRFSKGEVLVLLSTIDDFEKAREHVRAA